MTTIVISVLRIGGLVFGGFGIFFSMMMLPAAMPLMSQGGQGMIMALPALLSAFYPIVTGAALYGFAEVISLLTQIRDRA